MGQPAQNQGIFETIGGGSLIGRLFIANAMEPFVKLCLDNVRYPTYIVGQSLSSQLMRLFSYRRSLLFNPLRLCMNLFTFAVIPNLILPYEVRMKFIIF